MNDVSLSPPMLCAAAGVMMLLLLAAARVVSPFVDIVRPYSRHKENKISAG